MKKKVHANCFTILYKRQFIYDEYVLFTPCHYIEGAIDSSDNCFMDNSGNVFYGCNDFEAVENQIDLTHYFDISASDLLDRYKLYNAYEAVGLFYEEIRKVMLIGKIDREKRIVDLFSISNEQLVALTKSPTYSIENGEGVVTISKTQLQMLLNIKNRDELKKKLGKFLKYSKGVETVTNQKGKNVVVQTNTDGSVIASVAVVPTEVKKEQPHESEQKLDALEMKEFITSHLIGQDSTVEDVITTIISNFNMQEKEERILPFIVGPTGSGKSFLFELIGKIVNRPVINVDCTNVTQEGYHGKSVDDILRELYYLCGKDVGKMQTAIVFLDEIDKKAGRGNYVSDIGAQQNLLKFIEGGTFVVELDKAGMNKITVDTSRMLFAAGGAFEELFEKKKRKIGYGNSEEEKVTITRKDLVDFGMIPELVARFNLFEVYNEVTFDMMYEQLTTSLSSPVVIKKKQFLRDYGITLEFSDSFYKKLCGEAIEQKSGFRGINAKVNECLIKAQFKLQQDSTYSKLIISDETIDNPYVYQLIK